jgi:ribonuclease III
VAALSFKLRNYLQRSECVLAPAALKTALTHRSSGKDNYERFEFLGDSIANMICAELLFTNYPLASEGELTRLRTHLVDEAALASFARDLELSEVMIMGAGELKSGGFRRESILADVFEALIAACFLEGGLAQAKRFMLPFLEQALPEAELRALQKDGKTQLQEYLQERALALPVYTLIEATGPEHNRRFVVSVQIDASQRSANVTATGTGSSLKRAEQASAAAALEQIKSRLRLSAKDKA